ncbi:MAG: tripartite tricarboxylate transporter substrate binding protein [Spirochaetales bacterium]|jgi:tripartite-type tricarboxylate transporter receptor subunit TctC|nr:tripartite tricarboxylate transporter substrate binding protein [Spirochaetales bacterium]
MKKTVIVCVLLLGALGAAFAGGGSEAGSSGAAFPAGKPITLICPWAPGGGSDIGARMVVPYMEKKLGTTINVINPTGASGWVGWERMLSAPEDGYTFAMINLPTIFSGYLDPALGRTKTIDDFQMLGNHVTDFATIAIRTDETRFSDLKSFIAYAKTHPLTMTTTGVGTQQHILLVLFNAAVGINLTPVPGNGFKDSYAALLGKHVDAVVGSVGEVLVPEKNKELKTIVIFSEAPSRLMPHIPVWNKLGMGPNIVVSSQRAFACKKGTPPEIVKVLADALKDAITNAEQTSKMKELGLDVDYMGPEDFAKHAKSEEGRIKGLSDVMGWKK